MRYYRIVDDCYMEHFIAVEDECSVMLMPYTRSAERITKEEYERGKKQCRESIESSVSSSSNCSTR